MKVKDMCMIYNALSFLMHGMIEVHEKNITEGLNLQGKTTEQE